MTQATFQPKEHMMKIGRGQDAKDYLPVQFRLVWFRQECPEGTISTELVHLDLEKETEEEAFVWNNEKKRSEKVMKTGKGLAIFKATITDGKGGVAVGTKMEKAASFGDWLEKAETGAVGRALAMLGYGTAFAPELNEQHRIVDSPLERPAEAGEAQNGNARPLQPVTQNGSVAQQTLDTSMKITEQQISSIRKLSEYLSKAEPTNLAEMSNFEAKKTIQGLTAEYRQKKAN